MKKKNLIKLNIFFLLIAFTSLFYYNMKAQNPANENRDMIIAEIQNLSLIAKRYFSLKKEFNGGGNSFSGWQVPDNYKETENAKYDYEITDTYIKIKATGNEIGYNNKSPVLIKAKITYANIEFEVLN